ncbi:hypothetical protein MBLNU230_g1166t1 [Neophaeotheca triangularis]
MAPVTRRSQAGANAASSVSKAANPKRVTRKQARDVSDSWEMLDSQYSDEIRSKNIRRPAPEDEDDDDEDDEEDEDDGQDMQLALQGPGDVNSAVNPIREIAERVGKEVDTFAENLDKYLHEIVGADDYDTYEASRALAIEYKEIAEEMVEELKHSHERDLKSQLRQEWSDRAKLWSSGSRQQSVLAKAASLPSKKADRVDELRRWQEEADTWELFRILLDTQYRPDTENLQAEKEERLKQLTPLHRYSTEQEIFERFCVESDLAKWRMAVKEWLEQTAENQGSDMEEIVEELEKRSGVSAGGRSHGWVDTREKIKGEKRIRAWPNPIDSPLPQITRSDNTELLVTTLDPDAPARQGRTLEKPDAQMDRAVWAVTWEMLRRGKSSEEIKSWFEGRNEAWRAYSTGHVVAETTSDALFRRMCFLTSQSGCSSDYEAAVYGILGGNQEAVEKVCHSVDDKFYIYFSSMLQAQFDRHMAQDYANRLPDISAKTTFTDHAVWDGEAADSSLYDLALHWRTHNGIREDSLRPIKMLQGFLLSNKPGNMVHTLGHAVSDLDQELGQMERSIRHLQKHSENDEDLPERMIVKDDHALRMIANMAIILRKTQLLVYPEDQLAAEDNVVVAYIQRLRAAGKYDMIPTYASVLSTQCCRATLGQVLQDIREPDEQRAMMNLLQSHGNLDMVAIVQDMMKWTLHEHPISTTPAAAGSFEMLEPSKEDFHPAQRIQLDFLLEQTDKSDEEIVSALQWFQQLKGQWKVTFEALSHAVKKALISGRFTCARAIVGNYPYEIVSERKSYDILNRSLNMMDLGDMAPETTDDAFKWQLLQKQSRTYYELQQLVQAIESMSIWRREEHAQVNKIPRPSAAPARLRKAFALVVEKMSPVVGGNILRAPLDEQEADDLQQIRSSYISELLIAYNGVLYSAGHLISREHLLDAMDLSVAIADERNGLQESLVAAGKMQTLVKGFAATSKAMLVLKAKGKPWKPKKGDEGRDLGLWEISTG